MFAAPRLAFQILRRMQHKGLNIHCKYVCFLRRGMAHEIRMGEDHALLTLEYLPESCLSRITLLITPKELCRCSVLSRTFKAAGNSDFVWEGMLPTQYPLLLTRVDTPLQFSSKKELYFLLCNPVSIDNGTKGSTGGMKLLLACVLTLSMGLWNLFWLDQATGKLCFMLSAKDLAITWGDDNLYWDWIIGNDSSNFIELAELIQVCWLEVRGQFDCKFLTPGIAYTVSFKLKLEAPFGWDCQPVKFEITTCGHHLLSARFLENRERVVDGFEMTYFRDVGDGWMEFDAGEFVVEENKDNPMEMKFCMREWEGGNWKGGLLLDGIKIQPSFLLAKGNNINSFWVKTFAFFGF